MVPVWMTLSDFNRDFKVTIIQRHITRKWYKIELYLEWPTNRKSYNAVSNGAIFNDLERSLPPVSISPSRHSLTLRCGTRYTHSFNGILIGGTCTRPTRQCLLNDLDWPWVRDLTKYLMTRSIARSLCNSWASCAYCYPPPVRLYNRQAGTVFRREICGSVRGSVRHAKRIRLASNEDQNVPRRPLYRTATFLTLRGQRSGQDAKIHVRFSAVTPRRVVRYTLGTNHAHCSNSEAGMCLCLALQIFLIIFRRVA